MRRAQAALLEIDAARSPGAAVRDKIGEERSQIAVLENDIRYALVDIAALSQAVALGERGQRDVQTGVRKQSPGLGKAGCPEKAAGEL